MPSAPARSSSATSSITLAVLLPPAPATTGTRPRATSTVTFTTQRYSSCVRVTLSPVVPQGARKSIPSWICHSTRSARRRSSSLPSRRNGVTIAVPQPVKPSRRVISHPQDLAKHVAKLEEALLPRDPARRQDRPFGEPLPAAGPVLEDDGIRFAVEPDNVIAGNVPRAGRGDARLRTAQVRAHQLEERHGRSRRRVLLGAGVLLVDVGVVLRQPPHESRGVRRHLEEHVHADREVGAVNQPDAAFRDSLPRTLPLVLPPGRAHHEIHSGTRRGLD